MGSLDESLKKRNAALAPNLIKALQSRKFEAYYCETAADAVNKAMSLIPEGATVSWGGSVTLEGIGMLNAVKKTHKVIDRDTAKTKDERMDLMKQAFFCGVYLTSVNAISEDGQLVNVDGMGNRVAAMSFGPESVIVIAGMNKVCKTLQDAYSRARNYASPVNAARVSSDTPCAKTGMCADCKSQDCICSYIVTTRNSRIPGRIKVILAGENLGF